MPGDFRVEHMPGIISGDGVFSQIVIKIIFIQILLNGDF